jgi:hypothetical protein
VTVSEPRDPGRDCLRMDLSGPRENATSRSCSLNPIRWCLRETEQVSYLEVQTVVDSEKDQGRKVPGVEIPG